MSAPAFDIPGYELVRELGAGGMATVFLATQRSLERKVAIKVMRRGSGDDNAEKRFLLEGRTMARLPHPNIVGVYDIVQNESINYIAMEFLEGGMLSERMREGLTLAEAISVVVQIAGALQFAHDHGIVHRDLKPANIMYRDAGTPVLTDFGIAKQQNAEHTRLTQTGMMIGTPTYMSPEQATGSDLDGRSDQYSLGVLFFEMLTGRAPFEGSTPIQVVLAHLNTAPPPLPAQFAFFQPLLDRMLAKDREQRYPDLRLFVRDLKKLLTASDDLLQKLRTDPDGSASEQLRALGFSDSQIHTGAGPSAARGGPLPRVFADAALPPRAASAPGVRMPAAPRRRRWWPAALVATLVLAVAAGWWALRGGEQVLAPEIAGLVNRQLEQVDRLIGAGKLVAPPGENAFELLQEAMQAALQHVDRFPAGEQRRERIAGLLRAQAEQALQANQFAVAETRIGEALAVLPDEPGAQALQQKIATTRRAAERQAKVDDLLGQAESARRAGRLVGEGGDNALALIREAIALDPQAERARQAAQALVDGLLAPVSQALDAGKLDLAGQLLQGKATWLAAEPGWQELSKRLQQTRQNTLRQQQLADLLAQARQQIGSGHLAEPAGANALESLQRMIEIDANADSVRLLRNEAVAGLLDSARASEKVGDLALALGRYDQILRIAPDQAEAGSARDALRGRMDAQQAQIASELAAARDAIAARRLYPPAADSAHAILTALLARDPANTQARQLFADLPKLALDAANALAAEERLDAAVDLLRDAQVAHPDRGDIALLAATLGKRRGEAAQSAERERLLGELQSLLASRRLDADSAARIAAAIHRLQAIDVKDADAAVYRDRFLRGLGLAIDSVSAPAQLDAWRPVLARVQAELGNDSRDMLALQQKFDARRAAVEADERARIAASSGTLVLNALPWANIEAIVDQASGKPVALPATHSTPLRIALPQGTYRIEFRHPDVAQPIVQVVAVKAGVTQTGNAAFATLTVAEFLRRAGYER